ncbi:Lateral organ boundaries LOB domain-containing protein [Dioscorea alata]|uniref:Lateral organ boundaries LOB domain-containing protein n=1 Tax=Dioscorea alata TaxID=55571 RepID=A0ACB7W3P6_DIOAL|nr:Lateral organ boundaries LOB domain-containing protein [Dioscorea alata]
MQKNGGTACASCKHQRKRCSKDCTLAPYFPAEKAKQFNAVQKVFGVSNITKMIKEISNPEDRHRTVEALIWEAECRMVDSVLGAYGQYQKVYEKKKKLEEFINTAQFSCYFTQNNSVQNNNINHHHLQQQQQQQQQLQQHHNFHENNVSLVPMCLDNNTAVNYQLHCYGRSSGQSQTQALQCPVSTGRSFINGNNGRGGYNMHHQYVDGQGHSNYSHQQGSNQGT